MDLTTNYLGLRLKNPLVAGASPVSRDIGMVRQLEDSGIAAVVVHSVFQEQIEHEAMRADHFDEFGAESHAEAITYTPRSTASAYGPDQYVEHVRRIKEAVDIPVLASLNGTTTGGWTTIARSLQDAGADGLELNVYQLATEQYQSAEDVENQYIDILEAVRESVNIPVALKLSPYFSSLSHFATRLDRAGVDGLVLFNRFYQPDIDLDNLDVVPNLTLSAPHEMRLPLRWIAILDPIVEASLAATTGIYTWSDVLKLLMVGADVTMLCATVLRNGPNAVVEILTGMQSWMEEHEYESVHQMQGSMNHRTCAAPAAFERANYIEALQEFS